MAVALNQGFNDSISAVCAHWGWLLSDITCRVDQQRSAMTNLRSRLPRSNQRAQSRQKQNKTKKTDQTLDRLPVSRDPGAMSLANKWWRSSHPQRAPRSRSYSFGFSAFDTIGPPVPLFFLTSWSKQLQPPPHPPQNPSRKYCLVCSFARVGGLLFVFAQEC